MSEAIKLLTKEVVNDLNGCIVVLDTETTGFSRTNDRIIEFGALKLKNGVIIDAISLLINPLMKIPPRSTEIHGITDDMVKDAITEDEAVPKIVEFIKDSTIIVGHNVSFDVGMITAALNRHGYAFDCEYLDTLKFARLYYPNLPNHKLVTLADYLHIKRDNAHRALEDVKMTLDLLRFLAYETLERGL